MLDIDLQLKNYNNQQHSYRCNERNLSRVARTNDCGTYVSVEWWR